MSDSKARRMIVHTVETAPEKAAPLLGEVQKRNGGYIPNLLGVLATSPAALEMYLTGSKINASNSLSAEEREVVQLVTATTNGCGFCVAGHTAISKKMTKLTEDDINALRNETTLSDSKLAALAAFTAAVIAKKGAVSDEELQQFKDAGYGDQQALDVLLGVAVATLSNFGNNLAQTALNPELAAYAWKSE